MTSVMTETPRCKTVNSNQRVRLRIKAYLEILVLFPEIVLNSWTSRWRWRIFDQIWRLVPHQKIHPLMNSRHRKGRESTRTWGGYDSWYGLVIAVLKFLVDAPNVGSSLTRTASLQVGSFFPSFPSFQSFVHANSGRLPSLFSPRFPPVPAVHSSFQTPWPRPCISTSYPYCRARTQSHLRYSTPSPSPLPGNTHFNCKICTQNKRSLRSLKFYEVYYGPRTRKWKTWINACNFSLLY